LRSSQVTIKDIARELGISPSTVSRALKDHPDISMETKKAVTKLAEDLNYQPNSIALSLRHRKTNTIGVIIPEIVHFFFSTVISGIEDVAYSRGYSVIISQSNESYNREVIDTQALFNNRVDGMLISMSKETKDFAHFEAVHRRGVPIVFFDRQCDAFNCSTVLVDDFNGGYQATEHLLKQGYRRIVHLEGPDNLEISKQRLMGYKTALKEYGIEFDPAMIIQDDVATDEVIAKRLTLDFLSKANPLPDAIFASNDICALGSIQAIKEFGLKVPDDIGVVGFSNWQFTSMTEPSISTISQPGFEMGQEAARLLIREIEADDDAVLEPIHKTFKTELVVRGSSVRG
jgi:LacI family transcriptional regulator